MASAIAAQVPHQEYAQCSICTEPVTAATKTVLVCSHIFHDSCIREWKERQDSCPFCRHSIVPLNLNDPWTLGMYGCIHSLRNIEETAFGQFRNDSERSFFLVPLSTERTALEDFLKEVYTSGTFDLGPDHGAFRAKELLLNPHGLGHLQMRIDQLQGQADGIGVGSWPARAIHKEVCRSSSHYLELARPLLQAIRNA